MLKDAMDISEPELEGVDSAAVLGFVRALCEIKHIHGYVLLRHGKIISEGYWSPASAWDSHQLFSLSKSFVSTAFGIASGEGLVSTEDKLVDFFPEYMSEKVSERMKRVKMRHLLTMSSGHSQCPLSRYWNVAAADAESRAAREEFERAGWVRTFLESELAHEPGEKFVYNSAATFMVAAVLRKVTGESLTEYLRPRLFDPLGFGDVEWETNPEGINLGGWGLWLSVRELALFGQLWLRGGVWNGRRLIPAGYVEAAVSMQISNGDASQRSDWTQGYGFQFWRCRNNCYRADGYAGQYILVMPEKDMVLALTSGITDMQKGMDVFFDHLMPAANADGAPLPANAAAASALRREEGALAADLGPCGEYDPDFGSGLCAYSVESNALGLTAVDVVQSETGVQMRLFFENGLCDTVRAGFSGMQLSSLGFVYDGVRFDAYARACRAEGGGLKMHVFIPCSPSYFVFEFRKHGGGTAELSWHTNIWFRHETMCDASLKCFAQGAVGAE